MPDEEIFSKQYGIDEPTHAEEPKEVASIELQLEEQVKKAVQVFGTGKPTREVVRAKIVDD